MEAVAAEVNAHAAAAGQPSKSVDEVAMGFVRVANETMCRPIRALTQMKVSHSSKGGSGWGEGRSSKGGSGWGEGWAVLRTGREPCCPGMLQHVLACSLSQLPLPPLLLCSPQGYDVTQHVLACFGGAGGQHACAIAAALGMRTIFVHRYSGILSAVGIGLAEVVQEAQVGRSTAVFMSCLSTQCMQTVWCGGWLAHPSWHGSKSGFPCCLCAQAGQHFDVSSQAYAPFCTCPGAICRGAEQRGSAGPEPPAGRAAGAGGCQAAGEGGGKPQGCKN